MRKLLFHLVSVTVTVKTRIKIISLVGIIINCAVVMILIYDKIYFIGEIF